MGEFNNYIPDGAKLDNKENEENGENKLPEELESDLTKVCNCYRSDDTLDDDDPDQGTKDEIFSGIYDKVKAQKNLLPQIREFYDNHHDREYTMRFYGRLVDRLQDIEQTD